MIDYRLPFFNSKTINLPQRFFLSGQSNSDSAQEGTVPLYLQSAMNNVDGLGHNVYIWVNSANEYQILQWNINTQCTLSPSRCGQELILGYFACNYYKADIYINKRAEGNTPLQKYISGDPDTVGSANGYLDWDTESTNELFTNATNQIQNGTNWLIANGKKWKDNAMIWIQGENDAKAVDSSRYLAYQQNLTDLWNGFKAKTNNSDKWKFIACVLNNALNHTANNYLYKSQVQTAQRTFAASNSNCYAFELTGYPMIVNEGGVIGNSVHYPVDSHIAFTTDIFNEIIK